MLLVLLLLLLVREAVRWLRRRDGSSWRSCVLRSWNVTGVWRLVASVLVAACAGTPEAVRARPVQEQEPLLLGSTMSGGGPEARVGPAHHPPHVARRVLLGRGSWSGASWSTTDNWATMCPFCGGRVDGALATAVAVRHHQVGGSDGRERGGRARDGVGAVRAGVAVGNSTDDGEEDDDDDDERHWRGMLNLALDGGAR